MYSYIWYKKAEAESSPAQDSGYSDTCQVKAVLPLLWQEHCVECAAPLCYKSCKIYLPRTDKLCKRFANGVQPVCFPEQALRGGTIQFRRWAKLEAVIPDYLYGVSIEKLAKTNARMNTLGRFIEQGLAALSLPLSRFRLSRIVETIYMRRLLHHRYKQDGGLDGFLMRIYNHENSPHNLYLELTEFRKTVYKRSFCLQPGWNESFIPIEEFPLTTSGRSLIQVYLDSDATATLSFRYLDFVSLQQAANHENKKPAGRVKCVAWDLDNTLWNGVIGDDGQDQVTVQSACVLLIKELDRKGVLQTIVSKNNFDIAWNKIKELNLEDYFLYPAINWGRKSRSLLSIAKELNIHIDTFAVIDDSAFERMEIANALPQVRVYDVTEINTLLQRPEFDLPITEESAKRRQSYLVDYQRKNILASWEGNYDSFLASCHLAMEVRQPVDAYEQTRCLELLQRSNQYNLSRSKYDETSFQTLLNAENSTSCYCRVSDTYGDYGIVGFVTFTTEGNGWKCKNFVMSCRVAQKKIERALMNHIINRLPAGTIVEVDIEKTERNLPLRDEFKKMPFDVKEDNDRHIAFSYRKTEAPFLDEQIVEVR